MYQVKASLYISGLIYSLLKNFAGVATKTGNMH